MKAKKISEFLRSFEVKPAGTYDLFLGAGCSVAAGIPSGSALIWEFCKWQVEMHLARKTILHLPERKKWFNPPLLFEF